MNIILLGGNSKKNKDWLLQLAEYFKSYFNEIVVQNYAHWDTDSNSIDIESEVQRLSETTAKNQPYVIFAKSIGVVLVLKAVYEGKINPKQCVFVGTAVNLAHKLGYEIDIWFKDYNIPTLLIQNNNDPAVSSVELKNILDDSNVKNYQLVELIGNTHDYQNIEELGKASIDFLN